MAKVKQGSIGLISNSRVRGRDPIRHKFKKTRQGNSKNTKKVKG